MRYLVSMKPHVEVESTREFQLPGACIVCGGDLAVRIGPGTARSLCLSCHWMSRPQLRRDDDGVEVVHPAALA